MDTSYHLGWQTEEALYEKATGNCELLKRPQLWGFTVQCPLVIIY